MKPARTGMGTTVIALSIIVVVLGAAFAYYYATTESQISSLNGQVSTLKESGHSFCLTVYAAVSTISTANSNITQTLQQEIQNDNSLIGTLNSTKPADYEGMTATLNTQIKQDVGVISLIGSFTTTQQQLASPAPTFCDSTSQP
jgi:Mn2+/Fe2+ NRAMP family transporter